ncbi:hypothetical protein B566_EDAN010589 [Ephemera danica]|nr:hypothetical protein B566_EDAN010589 [Ephemera danica]
MQNWTKILFSIVLLSFAVTVFSGESNAADKVERVRRHAAVVQPVKKAANNVKTVQVLRGGNNNLFNRFNLGLFNGRGLGSPRYIFRQADSRFLTCSQFKFEILSQRACCLQPAKPLFSATRANNVAQCFTGAAYRYDSSYILNSFLSSSVAFRPNSVSTRVHVQETGFDFRSSYVRKNYRQCPVDPFVMTQCVERYVALPNSATTLCLS